MIHLTAAFAEMNLVFFTHPPAFGSVSMRKFADMIGQGMQQRGHKVSYWTSPSIATRFISRTIPGFKWFTYIDQYLIYPALLFFRLKFEHRDTLFVITDQALGIWVPQIAHRPHVVHVHDLLALNSALGKFPENTTRSSGIAYQKLIRQGFRKGQAFIAISKATQDDLHRALEREPHTSEMVHLGLNYPFGILSENECLALLPVTLRAEASDGFFTHVGGDQWYKNREGVVLIYQEWCRTASRKFPLWLIGSPPSEDLRTLAQKPMNGGSIRFIHDFSNEQVKATYNLTKCVIFPSLEEGFGWPIAEAMACGAPVITTDKAPMTEVGGEAAFYLRRKTPGDDPKWSAEGAQLLHKVINLDEQAACETRENGHLQAAKFSTTRVIENYEVIYHSILKSSKIR